MDIDKKFILLAIEQSQKSVDAGGFPAGAVIVKNGEIISQAVSIGYLKNDPSGHAESLAIREACKLLGTPNLEGATLYESVECCVMCFSTAYWAGIKRIVFACRKTTDMVSKHYYEGNTDNKDLNEANNIKIELVYLQEYEHKAKKIIEDWENKGGFDK